MILLNKLVLLNYKIFIISNLIYTPNVYRNPLYWDACLEIDIDIKYTS